MTTQQVSRWVTSRYGLFVVLGLIAAFIVAWIVDIAVRPVTNAEGLKGALNARSRSKAHLVAWRVFDTCLDENLGIYIYIYIYIYVYIYINVQY